jgi:2-amino-4-hydroxy-6-hydroxymethyldihydropteridine diphosphokinase
MRVYLGVGSNLGDRWARLAHAGRELRTAPGITVVRASRVWDTAPIGPPQPRYLNAVLELETTLAPLPLLDVLQRIENTGGRARGPVRWTARTLDLDLLLYGDEVVRNPRLVVPHPDLVARRFVLAPLAELCPDLVVPGTGRTVAQLLALLAAPDDATPAGTYPL